MTTSATFARLSKIAIFKFLLPNAYRARSTTYVRPLSADFLLRAAVGGRLLFDEADPDRPAAPGAPGAARHDGDD